MFSPQLILILSYFSKVQARVAQVMLSYLLIKSYQSCAITCLESVKGLQIFRVQILVVGKTPFLQLLQQVMELGQSTRY